MSAGPLPARSTRDRLAVLFLEIAFGAGFAACTAGDWLPVVPSAGSTPRIEWTAADRCVDGHSTEWRLFLFRSGNIVETFPSSTRVYRVTTGGNPITATITLSQPELGGQICFGAQAGNLYWGVGINGNRSCEGCCVSVPRAGTVTEETNFLC